MSKVVNFDKISTPPNWYDLDGGKDFFKSLTNNVPFNLIDEVLAHLTDDLGSHFDAQINAPSLCKGALKAELRHKFSQPEGRYEIDLAEELS